MKSVPALLCGGLIVWTALLASPVAWPQSREETSLWDGVKDSKDAEDYRAYLDKYPDGVYAPIAKRRIASLKAASQPAAVSAPPAASHPPADGNDKPAESSKTLPTDEASNAEIDAGFRRWSAGWMFDRYVPGSAHATERALKQDTYVIRGMFDFVRGGGKLSIPYAASYSKSSDRYVLSNLCYNDTSTGMTDCANPSNPGAMQNRQFLGSIVLLGMVAAMSSDETCIKRYTFFGSTYLECYD